MNFIVFGVLAVVMIATGTSPHQYMGPDLPQVRHARVVGYLTWGANRDDAMIAVVSRDGRIYFGTEQVTSAELPAKIRERLSKGCERRMYIKADKRARYAAVKAVLQAMQSAGVEQASILAYDAPSSSLR